MPVDDDVTFTKKSYGWMIIKKLELCFRKETFTVADFLCQAAVLNSLTAETVFLVS